MCSVLSFYLNFQQHEVGVHRPNAPRQHLPLEAGVVLPRQPRAGAEGEDGAGPCPGPRVDQPAGDVGQ
jgi:hypothetical protein